MMKCCICAETLDPRQIENFPIFVAGQNLAACGPEHQKIAQQHPDQCYFEAEIQGWTQDADQAAQKKTG
jgi:hypothetical protein